MERSVQQSVERSRAAVGRTVLPLAFIMALGVAACGHGTPATLEWQPGILLTWNDFTAPPPEHPRHDAETATGISASAWSCDQGRLVVVGARAYFNRLTSFALAEKADAGLLKHEQGHFDLTELYARELRARIRATPCEDREPAVIQAAVDEAVRDVNREFLVESERYDRETDHGRDKVGQQHWDQQLRDRLELSRGK
jgi:hypothetical protein